MGHEGDGIVLFLWYLLTLPSDRLVCSLWVAAPPPVEAVIASCGTDALGAYRLDVYTLDGDLVCQQPASALATVHDDCGLTLRLDNYRLQIINPAVVTVICTVVTTTESPPTLEEVADQCPEGLLRYRTGDLDIRYMGTRQAEPDEPGPVCAAPSIPAGRGLYLQPSTVDALETSKPLTWLAGRLIWHGLVRPECPGGTSGLDPVTLAANPCGMDAAMAMVIEWQNQWDAEIYRAAVVYAVPARLLKAMIGVESQFWPLYVGAAGEMGILQVTEHGADVLLRYDPELSKTYVGQTEAAQYWSRLHLRNQFNCVGCSLALASERTRSLIPLYARLLAAYRCRAVSLNAALSGTHAWRQAVMDYNGSEEYLTKVEMGN
jgi:hypothetical protein